MLVLEEAREMLLSLYREICWFSRDVVGRAVVLDGGALGSGGLGPATLSTRQVVREGPRACAGRRAVSASPTLEGNTVTPLRQHGHPHPLRVLRHLQKRLHPSSRAVPPRSDSSSPVPLSGSPEPCSCNVMIPLDTVHLTFKRSCQFFALLPFSKVFQICC